MIIDKNTLLQGGRSEFLTLIKPHFFAPGSDKSEPSESYRSSAAKRILAEYDQLSAWPQGLNNILLAELAKLDEPTPDILKAELRFSLMMLDAFTRLNQLEAPLHATLLTLRPLLLVNSIHHEDFWLSDHPLKTLIDKLYKFSVGYVYGLGKTSDALADVVIQIVNDLLRKKPVALDELEGFVDSFDEKADKALERNRKVSNRLKEGEAGALKAQVANESTEQFMTKLLRNKILPQMVTKKVTNELKAEIKLLIIRDGIKASSWIELQKILKTVVSLYQPNIDLDNPAIKTLLTQAPNELQAFLQKNLGSQAEKFEQLITQLGFDFALISAGNDLDGLVEASVSTSKGQSKREISQALLEKAKAYDVGQWFIYKDLELERTRRVNLLLRLDDYEQVLFANVIGQKVLATDVENFAYLLSNKIIQPLFSSSIFKLGRSRVYDKLLENHQQLHESMVDEQTQLAKQLELKKQQLEAEKERQEAAEKARAEAERFAQQEAEAKAKLEEEKRAQAQEQIEKDTRKQVRLAIDSLALGTWAQKLLDDGETYKRVKLAVKFNATGRFVFVDEDGVTVAEFMRDDLVNEILQGRFKLLEDNQFFADRLAKVVTDIRDK